MNSVLAYAENQQARLGCGVVGGRDGERLGGPGDADAGTADG
jgi:hypothetical protein